MSSLQEKDVESAASSHPSEDVGHLGARTVEATHKVYGKYSKWLLFVRQIALGLAAYIYSLDGTTTYTYLAFATSSFGHHSLISTIQVAQSIIVAVGKPVIAKIADVRSRGSAYVIVLIFYVVGYIVIASARNTQAIAGGIVVYAVGYTGLQLLTQIVIADITTLKWRGLVSGLVSLPFVINAFVGSNVSTNVLTHSSWRWGYGMFAILVPVSLSPLIITLLWTEHKAKKLGFIKNETSNEPIGYCILKFVNKLDIFGLILLGASVALILLPLTLAINANHHWKNGSIIAMIFAKYPVIPKRFVLNRSVVLASLIGAFDFVSFYISFTYLFSFIVVVKPWSLLNATYFSQTQTVALTVFGILAGLCMCFIRRYKYVLVVGLAIRLLGCGLMIHSRGANASDAEIVWSQLLQGIGGGFASVASQVGAQASVTHADVAMVTAVVLLITEIGGSIGSAIAGALWTNLMPGKLAKCLSFLPADQQAELFSSITAAIQYPRGNPVREGVIQAYDEVMKTMTITATVIAVIPLALAFLMPNWYLGNGQNAVDEVGLSGNNVDERM
ncbi:Siderophore iron transporter 3 [Leucoagaricus sp. SymC.cos]|nr:Siderophore iron transporter 3 [Leucoagaricus sp. SymC.cos]